MKWLGVKNVRLKSLVLPGDFQARLKAPHVAARAKSIKEMGLIALPVVEWETKRLVAGCDRVAALTINGADIIEVRAVEGTDAELRRVMLAENIERRPSERAELIAEYVGEVEQAISARPEHKLQPGRPTTPRGAAREQVAEELGISKNAVRQAEARVAEKAAPAKAEVKRLYEDWDVPVPKSLDEAITAIIEPLDNADQLMRGVQGSLTRAIEGGDTRGELEELRGIAKKLAQDIRGKRPQALCPYCKGVTGIRKSCAGCIASGYILRSALGSVPAELKLRGADAMVSVDGKPVRLASLSRR